MTVTLIDQDEKLPPCGNCNANVLQGTMYRAVIFDNPHEIPAAIKTGELNLAVCPRCNYRGWLWPGTIIVDRGRGRAIFAVFGDAPISEKKLAQTWELIDESLFDSELRSSVVWVYDYRHIYEIICQPEEVYQLEVKSGIRYRRRLKITDISKRASQWIRDMKSIGGVVMTTRELEPNFLSALEVALSAEIEVETIEFNIEALTRVRDHIVAYTERNSASQEIVSDSTSAPPSGTIPVEEVLSGKIQASAKINHPASEVIRALQDLAAEPLPEGVNSQTDSVISEHYRAAQALLTGIVSPSGDITRLQQQLLDNCPKSNLSQDGQLLTWAEYLAMPLNGYRLYAAMEFQVLGQRIELFGSIVAHVAAMIAAHNNDIIARYVAALLISEFHKSQNDNLSTHKYLAIACLGFSHESEIVIKVPGGWSRSFAVCWQKLGRYFHKNGRLSIASMCSAISASHFAQRGDFDGEIRSRVDGLHIKLGIPNGISIEEIEQLVAYIRESANENSDLSVCELECMNIMAQLQLKLWSGNPKVFTLVMELEKNDDSKSFDPEEHLRLPIFAFAIDSEAGKGEDTGSTADKKLDSGNHNYKPSAEVDNVEDNEIDSHSGVVFLYEVSFSKDFTYIARAQVNGIPWLSSIWQSIQKAAELKEEQFWFSYYGELVRLSANIHPQLPIYFFRLMRREARELGFNEMPGHVEFILNLGIARSYLDSAQKQDGQLPIDSDLNSLLDNLEEYFLFSVQGNDPNQSQQLNIDPSVSMDIAELLEAAKRFESAAKLFQKHARDCELLHGEAVDPEMRNSLGLSREKALYRSARALLKKYRVDSDTDCLYSALDIIESYRSRSALTEADSLHEQKFQDAPTGYRSIKTRDLKGHIPPNCYVMIYALLFETDANDGFWFSVLVTPAGELLFPRYLDFDDVFQPVQKVATAFNNSRAELLGLRIDDARRILDMQTENLDDVLQQLGDVLVPSEVILHLRENDARRLMIVPESYLFSVPFPALQVGDTGRREYLFKAVDNGLTISVAPNLTLFQKFVPKQAHNVSNIEKEEQDVLAAIVSNRPTWRSQLTPLYGVKAYLAKALNDNQLPWREIEGTVDGFLKGILHSKTALFFGHGEVSEEDGSQLITDDGTIGAKEIEAFAKTNVFDTNLLVLVSCSGINPNIERYVTSKDVGGVHIALLRGGVSCIVGSTSPILAVAGVHLATMLVRPDQSNVSVDKRLLDVYESFLADSRLSSPIFWGHIVCFGNGT